MIRRPNGNTISLIFLLVVAVIASVLIYWAYRTVLPWTGQADPEGAIGPHELAQLALESTHYLQALTMAVFGGALLLFSQRVLGRARIRDDQPRRIVIGLGFVLLAASLLVGFINIEVMIEAADYRLVDEKMDDMRLLRTLQSAYLLLGVLAIGGTLMRDIIRGVGELQD